MKMYRVFVAEDEPAALNHSYIDRIEMPKV